MCINKLNLCNLNRHLAMNEIGDLSTVTAEELVVCY